MARKTLSDLGVLALKPRAQRYAHTDPELAGHYVRVTTNSARSYCAVARDPSGKQIWTTIGSTETMPIAEARVRAREIIRRVRDGLPAAEPKGESFADVAQRWTARHVRKNGLRSEGEITRLLETLILPAWKDRPFVSIRRSDIAALLDHVEDKHGARQADYCLAIVRGMMNWYASRRDDYNPPLARGMRRQSTKAQARARILDDDEIKAVWEAAGQCGAFGAMAKIALLTAQRRDKLAGMRWTDIKDGIWTIATETREKGNAVVLALPRMALEVIEARPRFTGNPFVFASGRGKGPLVGFSKLKARLDRLSGVSGWQFHDLRRSARSLMSRAGVGSDAAERVMGHVQPRVAATYDRHSYFPEKRDALARLAALVDLIVHQRPADVVPLRKK